MRRRRPSSTLFPYTTLFRSVVPHLVQRPVLEQDARGAHETDGLALHVQLDAAVRGLRHLLNSLIVKKCLTRSLRVFAIRRSEEHTSELQSQANLVCRLLLEK